MVDPDELHELAVAPARVAILKLVPVGYGMTRVEADQYARAAIAAYLDYVDQERGLGASAR